MIQISKTIDFDFRLKSYSSNSIYVDNNDISTFFDKDFDTLISVRLNLLFQSINEDMDFIKSFNCLNLNSVFKNLNNKAKIEVLIKCFFAVNSDLFQLKYEKDEIQNTYNKLQEKLENINENNETYINEKIGKYDQENYYLRCELDELKIKFQIMKIKKEETEKLYDGNLSKLEKSKGKYKEKEKMYYIAVLEKNEIENNFEGQIFKVTII